MVLSKIKRFIKICKMNGELFFLSLPGLVLLFVFSYLPMFGIVIAFKDYNYTKGLLGSDWVFLKNFKFFFTSEAAFRVTRNTILLNAAFILLGTIIAIAFAIMLFELGKRAVKVFQTVLFFPFFISWVVASYASYAMLNYEYGSINNILKSFGATPIEWYAKHVYWIFILFIGYLWKNVGYFCLIYYTGLLGIDTSYYEAAAIDGASRFQQIKAISLPLISPLIIMLVLLNLGKIFYSDFGLFYFLPRDSAALYSVTDVIDTYVYRALKSTGDLGMGAAAGLYQSTVGFLIVLGSNYVLRKLSKENALF